MITRWKKEFLERAPQLFEKTLPADKEEKDLEKLYAKIGQLEMERVFKKKLKETGSVSDRLQMVNRKEGLSIRCQCKLVSVNRGSFYYQPLGETKENLRIMRLMDEQLRSEGKLFDPVAAQLNGNIHCATNPDKKAFGFFEASSVSRTSYIIGLRNPGNDQYLVTKIPFIRPPEPDGCWINKVPPFWGY